MKNPISIILSLLPAGTKDKLKDLRRRHKYGNKYRGVIFVTRKEKISKVGTIEIGEYTGIQTSCLINWAPWDVIKIGKFCIIADEASILGGGVHNMKRVTTYPIKDSFYYGKKGFKTGWYKEDMEFTGPTIIGNDVWIARSAIVLPGKKIGDGAIVGAGSVVTKDVPPYAIVAGNPAKIVRYRFTEEQIKSLVEIKWWDWEINKIKENLGLFDNIDSFIKKFKK